MNFLKTTLLATMATLAIAQTQTIPTTAEATLQNARSLMSQTSTAYIPGAAIGALAATLENMNEGPSSMGDNVGKGIISLAMVSGFGISAAWYIAWMCSQAQGLPTLENVMLGLGTNLVVGAGTYALMRLPAKMNGYFSQK